MAGPRTDRILEAPRGFFSAAGGGYDADAIAGKLGKPWTFADPGVSIKPHPSGSLTHPGMTEMLRLIRAQRHQGRATWSGCASAPTTTCPMR